MKNIGIVVKSIDYKENSKIVYVYTNEGIKSIRAIGAKNPKKGLLGFIITGNIVSFIASDTSFPSLLEFNVEESIYDITKSIDKINTLNIIIEVINNLSDDANHKLAYPFVENIIKELINTQNTKKLMSVFLIKMLYPLGVAPNLKSCILCNRGDNLLFDINKGGAVCLSCNPYANKNYNIWKEYYFNKGLISSFSDCDFDDLLDEIKKYYYVHTGIMLNLHK